MLVIIWRYNGLLYGSGMYDLLKGFRIVNKNIKHLIKILSVVTPLFCGSIGIVYGVEVKNLYGVSIAATNRGEEVRKELLKEGLEQVLVKVSGHSNVLAAKGVQEALEDPEKFIQQYTYDANNIYATFAPALVNDLINGANLPVWGKNRPTVVAWLAMEENQKRHLVGMESDPSVPSLISNITQNYGLPLVLPLLDLQDVSVVTVTDVWGQFPSVLQKASARYGADAILVGRLINRESTDKPHWEYKWQLLVDDKKDTWEGTSESLTHSLKSAILKTTELLANQYGVYASADKSLHEQRRVLVGIKDIQTMKDYRKALDYLKSLATVDNVEVSSISATAAVFSIAPRGQLGQESLTQAIDLDKQMVSLASNLAKQDGVDLAYRWVR